MKNSTRSQKKDKPSKPYPGFPLFPHATNRWAKKILGRLHYFGPWDDPEGALQKYLDQKDALHAGRTPRTGVNDLELRDVLNHFLTAKKMLVESNEITPRTWADYHATCERIADAFGRHRLVDDLHPDDFAALRSALAKKWVSVAVGNEIQRVRIVFKHAVDGGRIDKPIRFGPGFKRPSKKRCDWRKHKKLPTCLRPGNCESFLKQRIIPCRP